MKLFLVVVLLVAGAEGAALGGEPCTWGPSYWCSSVQNAADCHALTHCVQHVWAPRNSHVQQTKECHYGKKMVKTIRHVLAAKNTRYQGKVPYMIASMCSAIQNDTLRKECKVLVTQYGPQITKLMDSNMEPSSVAAVMGLCQPLETPATTDVSMEKIMPLSQSPAPSTSLKKDPTTETVVKAPEQTAVEESVECAMCHFIVKFVDLAILSNQSEAEMVESLEAVCKLLPSVVRDSCYEFIPVFVSDVEALVHQDLDPSTVCKELQVCSASRAVGNTENLISVQKDAGDSEACELCQFVMNYLDAYLTSNTTEALVQQLLEDVCHRLPSSAAAQCLLFVDEYTAAILNLLVQEELNPQQVCQELHLCTSLAVKVAELTASVSNVCFACELVVEILEEDISADVTEAEVEKALDRVCALLPSSMVAECQGLVSQYIPTLLALLAQKMLPNKVCALVDLCPSALTAPVALPRVSSDSEPQSPGPIECELCKAIITEINKIIGENRSEAAIIHAVEMVCDLVHGDLRLQCQSEVENYGPAVINLLQHVDDPTRVCQYLDVCAATPTTTTPPPTTTSPTTTAPPHGQRLIGQDECSRGPAFWCASKENAHKCRRVWECVLHYGRKP